MTLAKNALPKQARLQLIIDTQQNLIKTTPPILDEPIVSQRFDSDKVSFEFISVIQN